MIQANSIQQYNKWKAWKNGTVKNKDMYILAETYINQIYGLCNTLKIEINSLTDDQIFNLVAKNIILF